VTRTECDNCRKLGEAPAPSGWVIVALQEEVEEGAYAGCRGADVAATLCSWQCAAEYASVKALVPAEDPQGSAP
jgi:hypothetical protein